jgi:hypothetical protein
MKRSRSTIIAVAILVALLAYVLLVESKKDPPPSAGTTPSPTPVPVLDIDLGEVRSVGVTDGQRTLRLVRQDGEWRLAEPEDAPADAYAVGWTVDELIHLDARTVVLDKVEDLATYGLDPPALILDVERVDGTVDRFHVGRETPDGTTFYLQHASDPRLYIVEHYRIEPLFEWLAQPPYLPTPTPATP